MKESKIKIASSATAGIGMFLLYFAFISRYIQLSDWSQLSSIEVVILLTLILRVVVILVVGRKIRIQPMIKIIAFSIEVFSILPLLVLVFITGGTYFSDLMSIILTSWFAASALVLSPYAIVEFSRSMLSGSTLSGIIINATIQVGGILFLASMLSRMSGPIVGLSGLGSTIILQVKSSISAGGISNAGSNPVILLGLTLFYVGLLSYLTLGAQKEGTSISVQYSFILLLAGTIVALVWTTVALQVTLDVLLVLTAPTFFLLAAIWGTAHEK